MLLSELNRCDIGLGEVASFVEKGLSGVLGQGIRTTITNIEPSRMKLSNVNELHMGSALQCCVFERQYPTLSSGAYSFHYLILPRAREAKTAPEQRKAEIIKMIFALFRKGG